MTVLSDKWIKKAAQKGMIRPFVNKQVRKRKISFGLSSYGNDARVSNEFKDIYKWKFWHCKSQNFLKKKVLNQKLEKNV
jgi:Deoxycytidine deaminase